MTLEENLKTLDELALKGQNASDYPYGDEVIYERCNSAISISNRRTPRRDFYKTVEQSKELLLKLIYQPQSIELLGERIKFIFEKVTSYGEEQRSTRKNEFGAPEVGRKYRPFVEEKKLYIEVSNPYVIKTTINIKNFERIFGLEQIEPPSINKAGVIIHGPFLNGVPTGKKQINGTVENETEFALHEINEINTVLKNFMK